MNEDGVPTIDTRIKAKGLTETQSVELKYKAEAWITDKKPASTPSETIEITDVFRRGVWTPIGSGVTPQDAEPASLKTYHRGHEAAPIHNH